MLIIYDNKKAQKLQNYKMVENASQRNYKL